MADVAETDQARQTVLDVTALVYQALRHDYALDVISNNRAWGNAPALAQRPLAFRVLDEQERRA